MSNEARAVEFSATNVNIVREKSRALTTARDELRSAIDRLLPEETPVEVAFRLGRTELKLRACVLSSYGDAMQQVLLSADKRDIDLVRALGLATNVTDCGRWLIAEWEWIIASELPDNDPTDGGPS